MNYNYRVSDNKVIRAFYKNLVPVDANHFGMMSWYEKSEDDGRDKEVNSVVLKDSDDKLYFIYHDKKIFVDDFLAYEPAELIKLMQNKSVNIYHEELLYTLMKYGIDSIHVMQKKKSMTGFCVGGTFYGFEVEHIGEDRSDWDDVEYKFAETDMFKLSDNYKIKLTPADDKNIGVYASRDYYVSDLFSLMRLKDTEFRLFENKAA